MVTFLLRSCHTKWRPDSSSQTSQQHSENQQELLMTSCRTTIKAIFQNVLLCQWDNSASVHLSAQLPVHGLAFLTLSTVLHFSLFNLSPSNLPPTHLHILLRRFKNRWLKIRTLHKNVKPQRHMENVHHKSLSLLYLLHWLRTLLSRQFSLQ